MNRTAIASELVKLAKELVAAEITEENVLAALRSFRDSVGSEKDILRKLKSTDQEQLHALLGQMLKEDKVGITLGSRYRGFFTGKYYIPVKQEGVI